MREIIFRGKTLLGEWVYGDLIHGCEPQFAYIVERGNKELCRNYIEVDPATVGQFTGKKSKSGQMIFKGDTLVRFQGEIGEAHFTVGWNADRCLFAAYLRDGSHYVTLGALKTAEIEVIGNAHDQQEVSP